MKNSPFFAGFAVDDLEKAKEFYGQTLEVEVNDLGGPLFWRCGLATATPY